MAILPLLLSLAAGLVLPVDAAGSAAPALQGVIDVNTTAQLRHALAHPPPNGRIAIRLAEGGVYHLNGSQLPVHYVSVTLWSAGSKHATIDAGGYILSIHIHIHVHTCTYIL